jgi:MerR family mercuric resistance operon transcriptional regulator
MPTTNTKLRAGTVSIGRLSERTGVNIETIRYYERIGLLPAPPRSEGRHRLYDESHGRRLVFIRRSRELGFSLEEVRGLLGLTTGRKLTCHAVKTLAEQHVVDIRRKVKDLKRLERVLTDLAARCHGNEVPDCPILEALGDRGVAANMPV